MTSSEAPVVSVIVPAYNAGRWITATIESALAQSFPAIEVLVVDDGSSDDTLARLGAIGDARLHVIRQPHRGAPAALHTGLEHARGEYIGFLDHDDLWSVSKVARHLEVFRSFPQTEVTFSWYGLIDEQGCPLRFRTPRWRGPIAFRELFEDYVVGSTSSLLMRRSAIEDAGGIDERFARAHDTDLVLRISLGHPGAVRAVPDVLSWYRRHSGQMSRDWRAMRDEWNALFEKLQRLAPAETAAAEQRARSNINRYYACLAYEEEEFPSALGLIWGSFRAQPRVFLRDWRNWKTLAACCSGVALPRAIHRSLERAAGIPRENRVTDSAAGSAVPAIRKDAASP